MTTLAISKIEMKDIIKSGLLILSAVKVENEAKNKKDGLFVFY